MRILAISSGGGHWKQLMRLKEFFFIHDVFYVTTIDGLLEYENITAGSLIPDFNIRNLRFLLKSTVKIFNILIKFKPEIIITTGAAPGLLALMIGKFYGAKTIWIDSIANSEKISLSGNIAQYISDHTLTQWEELESKNVKYYGKLFGG